jgi:hypothetical protein
MADDREMENGGPSNIHEEHEKFSSEDERKNSDLDPYRNESFNSQKEAQEYERKKANALLANPLRGYTHNELRKMGRNYALGKQSCDSCRTWHIN